MNLIIGQPLPKETPPTQIFRFNFIGRLNSNYPEIVVDVKDNNPLLYHFLEDVLSRDEFKDKSWASEYTKPFKKWFRDSSDNPSIPSPDAIIVNWPYDDNGWYAKYVAFSVTWFDEKGIEHSVSVQ